MTSARLGLAGAGGGRAERARGLRVALVAVGTRARGPPGALVGPAWPARSRVKQSISLQRAGEPALTPGSARRAPREPPRGLQQPRGSGRAHRALLASGTCLEAARLSRGASAWGVPVRGPRGGSSSDILVGHLRGASARGVLLGRPRGASLSGLGVRRLCRMSGARGGCPRRASPRMKRLLPRAFVIIQDVTSPTSFSLIWKSWTTAQNCKCGFVVFKFHGKTSFFDLIADSPQPRMGSPAGSQGERVCGG